MRSQDLCPIPKITLHHKRASDGSLQKSLTSRDAKSAELIGVRQDEDLRVLCRLLHLPNELVYHEANRGGLADFYTRFPRRYNTRICTDGSRSKVGHQHTFDWEVLRGQQIRCHQDIRRQVESIEGKVESKSVLHIITPTSYAMHAG